jgi:hypothetical protein
VDHVVSLQQIPQEILAFGRGFPRG